MRKKFTFSSFLLNRVSVSFLCLFLLSPFCSFSQAQLGTDSAAIPAVVYLKTSVSVSVTVTNTGNAVYNGPIDVYYGTDSTSYQPVLLGTILTASLSPGSSTTLFTNLIIDTSHFFQGYNIVVVWPTGSGIVTTKQGWQLIYVDTVAVAGVAQSHFDDGIRIYPNPAFSSLFVEYKSIKNHIEGVRIYDLLGNIIPLHFSPSLTMGEKINLDISDIPPGMYFLEIENSAGQRCIQKFVKYGN